jgi:hypothetical protein
MTTQVETGWYRSKLPEAIVEGTDLADDFVLVGAHYCSWEIGITDNATGDACLLELARALQAHRGELRRSVRLCWWPGHSHGRYSGSTWYADTFFHRLADHCVAYHNVDSPGVKGAIQYVARHTTAEVEGFCTGVIGAMTGQTEPPIHRPSRAADQSFLANGVPAFSTYPFLPEGHPDRKAVDRRLRQRLVVALERRHPRQGRRRHPGARHEDQRDRGEHPRDGRPAADRPERGGGRDRRLRGGVREATAAISTAPPSSPPRAPWRAPLRPFVARARAATDPAAQAEANRTLMDLSRVLLPVTYSKGGRYTHDPAEWSPIMRNTRSSLFPGLNPGLALGQLDGRTSTASSAPASSAS